MATAVVPLSERVARRGRASARLCPQLSDGAHTTVHVAAYAAELTEVRVVVLRPPEQLASWCRRTAVQDAIVGGFFAREEACPLGELRTRGVRRRALPFAAPWSAVRSCMHLEGNAVTLARRDELPPEPRGDLLQAGPLLVRHGQSMISEGDDPEGFSTGSAQFDSDITKGRYPRAAIGVGGGLIWAVACDGRGARDAGMTLAELAAFMLELGVDHALNLDGGGSTSLVCAGALVNRPREEHGMDLVGGRPIHTAVAFLPRG
ncbi:MAG: hypothetical protein NVS2B6_02200 [Thermoleophilaceae bacterium]